MKPIRHEGAARRVPPGTARGGVAAAAPACPVVHCGAMVDPWALSPDSAKPKRDAASRAPEHFPPPANRGGKTPGGGCKWFQLATTPPNPRRIHPWL